MSTFRSHDRRRIPLRLELVRHFSLPSARTIRLFTEVFYLGGQTECPVQRDERAHTVEGVQFATGSAETWAETIFLYVVFTKNFRRHSTSFAN